MSKRIKCYCFESISRDKEDGENTIIELSISNGTGIYDEEHGEIEDFERNEYLTERFFYEDDGSEIDSKKYFDSISEEYEEASWQEEYYTKDLQEAKDALNDALEEL